MHDGAVIPVERTAIPVEWDSQGPIDQAGNRSRPAQRSIGHLALSRFIDSAAAAMDGKRQAAPDP